MNPDQIEQIVNGVLDKREKANLYQVNYNPVHSHNGVDSLRVDPADLLSSESYFALREVTLASTQILSLFTTPFTLLPALGPATINANTIGLLYIVEGITAKINYGGVAYAGANNLEFRYGAGGTKMTADMSTTFLNQTASVFCHVAGVTTEIIAAAGLPVVVSVPVANPTTGNSQISFVVKYRVVML